MDSNYQKAVLYYCMREYHHQFSSRKTTKSRTHYHDNTPPPHPPTHTHTHKRYTHQGNPANGKWWPQGCGIGNRDFQMPFCIWVLYDIDNFTPRPLMGSWWVNTGVCQIGTMLASTSIHNKVPCNECLTKYHQKATANRFKGSFMNEMGHAAYVFRKVLWMTLNWHLALMSFWKSWKGWVIWTVTILQENQ